MKWFKHSTDLMTDPKMQKLINQFKSPIPYAMFCMLLEQIAKYGKAVKEGDKLVWKSEIILSTLAIHLQITLNSADFFLKKLAKTFNFKVYRKEGIHYVTYAKFAQYTDNWTARKLQSYDKEKTEQLPNEKNKNKNKKRKEEEAMQPTPDNSKEEIISPPPAQADCKSKSEEQKFQFIKDLEEKKKQIKEVSDD